MAKRRRKRKSKINLWRWFKKLSTPKKALLIGGIVVLFFLVFLVIFAASKFSKLQVDKVSDDEFIINEKEPTGNDGEVEEDFGHGYTNFALFGGDSRTGDVEKNLNTDAIIVVSLNNETKEVKMVSVYRDTLLDISKGNLAKCNSAYIRGGAKAAVNMLNRNLDLDIKRYVTVDFGVVVDVVDMVGGIEVDVSEAERNAINGHIWETALVTGKPGIQLTKSGLQKLDGVQATTYARIRKGVGDDYARTERQRLVIQKVAEKVMKSDFATLNKIIDHVLPSIATNIPASEIMKYARSFTKYKIGETAGFPFDRNAGTIPGKGDCVYPINLSNNVTQLHAFLFGTQDYYPSSTVRNISYMIQDTVASGLNSDSEEPDDEEPGTEEPGTENPGTQEPGVENPGTENPGTENPGTQEPGTENPGTENPGTQEPGTENPGTENPGTENPGTENPGTENPGTENPGTENPGTENLGTENSGIENP